MTTWTTLSTLWYSQSGTWSGRCLIRVSADGQQWQYQNQPRWPTLTDRDWVTIRSHDDFDSPEAWAATQHWTIDIPDAARVSAGL